MRKLALFLSLILFIGIETLSAQTKAISGKVVDDQGEAMPGVTVMVKGTTTGTITTPEGTYTLNVPTDATTLVFSFVGMKMQEIALEGRSTINVTMSSDSENIDEVVVTAMGIKRSEKSLGYAATQVKSDDLVKARNTNFTNSLSGKVAGLQVKTTSSDPGAATSVTIRGFGSINGSNQPLYVVDGVPVQNTTISTSGHSIAAGGIANIASNDIASMTVLKGAAATALYGSRASNGVIVITTKQGSKGKGKNFSIQYNGGVQLRQIAYLPEFQNEFGQGWDGSQTFIENGSWGPRLDGSTQVYGPVWNGQQLVHTYSAKPDNVKDFFDIGVSQSHNISLSGQSDDGNSTYYVSFSHSKDDGIMPTDADLYKRSTLAFRSTFKPVDWIKVSSSVNLAKSATDVVGSYQGTSVIDGLYEMPRDISIVDMKDLSSAFNTPEAYFTPYGITNPYWALENNYNHLDSKQVYGKFQVDINPVKDLTVTYRFGFDYTDYDGKVGYPEIDLDDSLIDEDYGYAPSNMNQDGYVYAYYNRSYELNHDFLATYDKTFNDFSVTAIVGSNVNERYWTSMSGETDGLTFDTGFNDLSNGSTISSLSESQTKRRLIGLFADVSLGYKDMLFLDLTARNDWSSTLPTDANNYFYPGATASWLFTEVMPKNDILTFGKIRVAYGKTGADADAYQTSTGYDQASAYSYYSTTASFPMNSTNAFLLSSTSGSVDLQPEMTTEKEIGLNLQFLHNRIGLDAAVYDRRTDKQVFTLPVDPATGYSYRVVNFGEVQNKGIELLLHTSPVKASNFRWDLDINFAVNKNKVLSMPADLEDGKTSIYSFSAGNDAVYMYAEKGQAMGEYYTYLPTYVTDKTSAYYGDLIVDSAGQPVLTEDVEDTGKNMNHKWTGGINTSISSYGFTLSAALDVRYGGYMFSRTKNLMLFTGNGIETLYNDRNPFAIPNSVVEGTSGYEENTTQLKLTDDSMQSYYSDYGMGQGGEAYLVDRSFAKIRNITLAYTLPKSLVNKAKLSDVTLSAFVNNPFIWTADDNYYVDPESTTTGSDLSGMFGELYTNPSSRIYGFNLSITY